MLLICSMSYGWMDGKRNEERTEGKKSRKKIKTVSVDILRAMCVCFALLYRFVLFAGNIYDILLI